MIDTSAPSHKSNAAIIGGVVGGIALLVIALLLFSACYHFRRLRRRNEAEGIQAFEPAFFLAPATAPPPAEIMESKTPGASNTPLVYDGTLEERSPTTPLIVPPSSSTPTRSSLYVQSPPSSPAPPSFVTTAPPTGSTSTRLSAYQQEVLQSLLNSQAAPETIASVARLMESGEYSTMSGGTGAHPPEYDFKG